MKPESIKVINVNEQVKIDPRCGIYNGFHAGQVAHFAMDLMRAGVGSGRFDGEHNPDGSQKMVILTPQELVTRACDIASVAFAEFGRRGWLMDLPNYDEMVQHLESDDESEPVGFGHGHATNGQSALIEKPIDPELL